MLFTRSASRFSRVLALPFVAAGFFATACSDDEPSDDPTGTTTVTTTTSSNSTSSTDSGSDSSTDTTPVVCMDLATDFNPGANDSFGACISDDGAYHLAGTDTPGAVARLTAYEMIAELTWRATAPVPAPNFLMARSQYEINEGLASRVARREDLHYPEIPIAEQKPDVDWDKQCSVAELATKYPDRCPGPQKIGPEISKLFLDSQVVGADNTVLAGRLHGALDWFLFLSIYKEAYTCFQIKAEDCDAAWAYFNGGAATVEASVGLAKAIAAIKPEASADILTAILGVRCVRDLYRPETYPTHESLPPEAKTLFANAWEQLDDALHYGYALLIHRDLLALAANPADTGKLAYVRVAGTVLLHEASERHATLEQTNALSAALTNPAPLAADFSAAAEALAALFPCPQG